MHFFKKGLGLNKAAIQRGRYLLYRFSIIYIVIESFEEII